jgi:hypothetical protein
MLCVEHSNLHSAKSATQHGRAVYVLAYGLLCCVVELLLASKYHSMLLVLLAVL